MKLLVVLTIIFAVAAAKIYSPAEFARALRRNGIPENQIKTWQCIAKHESNYNTAARNYNTGDHGILQISQIWWCSPPGRGCGVSCASLRDDDINNDIQCAKKIFQETQRFSGNGFTAWTVYPRCRNL